MPTVEIKLVSPETIQDSLSVRDHRQNIAITPGIPSLLMKRTRIPIIAGNHLSPVPTLLFRGAAEGETWRQKTM